MAHARSLKVWKPFQIEMGFDLAQVFLFAKRMPARKFARIALGQPVRMMT
jgi:hypothetical protein